MYKSEDLTELSVMRKCLTMDYQQLETQEIMDRKVRAVEGSRNCGGGGGTSGFLLDLTGAPDQGHDPLSAGQEAVQNPRPQDDADKGKRRMQQGGQHGHRQQPRHFRRRHPQGCPEVPEKFPQLSFLHRPDSGEILIDGVPAEQFDPKAYWELVGTVFQDVSLLPFTQRPRLGGRRPPGP